MEDLSQDSNLAKPCPSFEEIDELVLRHRIDWAVQEATTLKSQGKKVLIYCKKDATAITLNQKMRDGGLNSHEVATVWTKPECAVIVSNFNESTHPIDVLITTFATLKTSGPRFYGVCHRGIILEYPDEFDEFVKVTQCLQSIGQTQAVDWLTCFFCDTLDIYPNVGLSCQGGREPTFGSKLSSRSLFYSAVARFVKESPTSASKFNRNTMARIAKSWKPGQALTADHVDLKLPEIDEGVVLYNHVKEEFEGQL
ncbi:hypothetical protein FBEOM_4515 [Fusarium beomiforme]|uniref:Uncharacterized protein n=1 Tax=Fusarium beomiforme TaxID=44412 RepID=A0A9P5AMV2_9HYPO|nr:hypothetical protein FBEOM_4515 [Fusarium beomiforme]